MWILSRWIKLCGHMILLTSIALWFHLTYLFLPCGLVTRCEFTFESSVFWYFHTPKYRLKLQQTLVILPHIISATSQKYSTLKFAIFLCFSLLESLSITKLLHNSKKTDYQSIVANEFKVYYYSTKSALTVTFVKPLFEFFFSSVLK